MIFCQIIGTSHGGGIVNEAENGKLFSMNEFLPLSPHFTSTHERTLQKGNSISSTDIAEIFFLYSKSSFFALTLSLSLSHFCYIIVSYTSSQLVNMCKVCIVLSAVFSSPIFQYSSLIFLISTSRQYDKFQLLFALAVVNSLK